MTTEVTLKERGGFGRKGKCHFTLRTSLYIMVFSLVMLLRRVRRYQYIRWT